MKTLYLTDLDGTLLNGNQRVSEYSERVIDGLVGRGALFSFATARSEESARPLVSGFRISAPPILYNGAVVGYADGPVPPICLHFGCDVSGLIQELLSAGVSPIVYSFIDGKEKFSFLRDKYNADTARFLKTREHCVRYRPVDSFGELIRGEIFYLTCIDTEAKLGPFNEKYKSVHHCVYQKDIYTDCQWLEIMPKNSTKANAALALKKRLGCDELVVFGDNKNDLELFGVADRRYAVANAVAELKQMATAVIESNDADGVAHFLERDFT